MQQEHTTFSVMMPMSMFVYRMLIEAPAALSLPSTHTVDTYLKTD